MNARTGFGVRGRYKLVWQTVVAVLAAFYIQRHFDITGINVPLVGELAVGAVACSRASWPSPSWAPPTR